MPYYLPSRKRRVATGIGVPAFQVCLTMANVLIHVNNVTTPAENIEAELAEVDTVTGLWF